MYVKYLNYTVYLHTEGCGKKNEECHKDGYCAVSKRRRGKKRVKTEKCKCKKGLVGDGIEECTGTYSICLVLSRLMVTNVFEHAPIERSQ